MVKVSVIIPVYNTEEYLKSCIDSVIRQSLKEIEIICVDDGSTDACPQILDDYAKMDERIVVVHKENGGYGNAINIGMKMAKGEYVGIVESDDMILANMYERLYEQAKTNDLDIIKGGCYFCWDSLKYRVMYKSAKRDIFFNTGH